MEINTKNFGILEILEEDVITFEDGIPGFPDLKKYILINSENDNSPFYWLQSIEDVSIAFTMMDVFQYIPNYNPTANDTDVTDIVDLDEKNIEIYNIAVIPHEIEKMSVNLKAPVIINVKTKKGKQIISNNENYEIKYYIYQEIQKLKAGV